MKRPRKIAREITQTDTEIAKLCENHARIGRKIAELKTVQKGRLTQLATEAIDRLDVGQVPIEDLLLAISCLGQSARSESVSAPPPPPGHATVEAFVKISSNCSARNRAILVASGLHWHGRDEGWRGHVTEDQLTRLRDCFGERLKEPTVVGAEEGEAREGGPGAVSAAAAALGEAEPPVEAAVPDETTATTSLRVPIRGLPARRPART